MGLLFWEQTQYVTRFQTGQGPSRWRDHQRVWLATLRAECQDLLAPQGALATGGGVGSRGQCLGSEEGEGRLALMRAATSPHQPGPERHSGSPPVPFPQIQIDIHFRNSGLAVQMQPSSAQPGPPRSANNTVPQAPPMQNSRGDPRRRNILPSLHRLLERPSAQ